MIWNIPIGRVLLKAVYRAHMFVSPCVASVFYLTPNSLLAHIPCLLHVRKSYMPPDMALPVVR